MSHRHDEPKLVQDDALEAHHAWLENRDGGLTTRLTRKLSAGTSRRGVLARIGAVALGATGAALLPDLPVPRGGGGRAAGAQSAFSDPLIDFTGTDPTDCNYWRYCNLGGRICAQCEGGGITTCPPGTVLGNEYWVGCCTDPVSGRNYLTANYDCCGKSGCGGSCGEPWQQDTPINVAPGSMDRNVLWCMSDPTQSYTCTVVPLIGEDCTPRPSPRTRAEFDASRGQ